MEIKQKKVLDEMISNPQRITFSRKGSTDADDLTSIILHNPTLEKINVLKEKCFNLEYLKLTKVSDPQVIQPIRQMRKTEKLFISILSHVKEPSLAKLNTNFQHLRQLRIQIDGGILEQQEISKLVSGLPKLQKFQLHYNRMSLKSICIIVQGLPQLTCLSIPGAKIGNQQLLAISKIKKLKQLDINQNHISYEGIKVFSQAKLSMQIFKLCQNLVTNKALRWVVSGLPKLQILHLDGCMINNAGALYISKLRHLKQLKLDFNILQSFSTIRLLTNLKRAGLVSLRDNFLLGKRFWRMERMGNRIWQKIIT